MLLNNMQNKLERPDYPDLYDSANNASLTSQKEYTNIMKLYLWLTAISAFLTIYVKESKFAGIIATLFFLVILGLTIYQSVKRQDKIWYNGRAVAESVKTRTWRFIMRAEPYIDCDNIESVKQEFCNDLKEILKQNQSLGSYLLQKNISTKGNITDSMIEIRSYSLKDRLNYYISNRIMQNRNRYLTKAKYNREQEIKWFYSIVAINFLIILLLLLEIGYDWYFLPTSGMIVLSSTILTWTQIKKFQELATSYSLTAHEIGLIKDESFKAISESTLSDFVKDSENAFSREHTQWIARKDTP